MALALCVSIGTDRRYSRIRPDGDVVEFRLLGSVEAWDSGRPIDLGHARQRCVLAVLLLEAGQIVPAGTLIDRVWGHQPPDGALNVLYSYAARLRRTLGPSGVELVIRSGGSILRVTAELVDVHRFRRLLVEAETADAPDRAIAVLDEALALWRGTPFSGLASPWLDEARQALTRQYLSTLIDRNEAYLRGSRHAELIDQLSDLVVAHPAEERLAAQLMVALYRSGRTADALDQYQATRQKVADRLGIEPGPLLRRLHQ